MPKYIPALPKPKDMKGDKPAVIIYADGREKCTRTKAGMAEYRKRREAAWVRDRGICHLCKQPVSLKECTADHVVPRGMGGSTRDDRIRNMKPAHMRCNIERGSKRME